MRVPLLLLGASAILALPLFGCAMGPEARVPATVPSPQEVEQGLATAAAKAGGDAAAQDAEGSTLEDYDRAVASLLADAEAAESRRLALDEPEPEENVEPSPLDEIADVVPGAEGSLEEERQLVESAEPTFDYPIEINDKVLAYIDYFTTRHREKFQQSLIRSGRYLGMIQSIFEEEGIPRDLAYMAHVESAFKVNAYSRAKAKGIFQFISGTGRRYGMRIDTWVDERSDPERSARAAAAYLRDLYGMFGDWYLALAAYNTGEGRIQRSINRMGPVSFWDLARTRNLYRETKNYVPAILAATVIAKQPERYGFEAPHDEPLHWETVEVPGAIHFDSLARVSGVDAEDLRLLNPHLRRQRTPPSDSFPLRVPVGAGERILATVASIPDSERVVDAYHKVRRGENLSVIARRYGVSVRDIQAANSMGRRTVLRAGQTLVIPGAARGVATRNSGGQESAAAVASVPREGTVYRVRRGDTLSRIAGRYGTTPATIASANGIRVHSTLRVGQRLRIPGPGADAAAAASRSSSDGPEVLVHTVRRGENLWRIAGRYRVTVDQICTLNDIKPDVTLYPGTRLTIRAN
jgi:membrane-bound lytic murein transglycosylase D